jgi:hypothetical protein
MHSITVDELYLNAFLASGVRSGIFKRTDYGDELNEQIPRFRTQIRRVHELLLLFDHVVLTRDYGGTLGYDPADYKLPLPLSVATRLLASVRPDIPIPDIDLTTDRALFFERKLPAYLELEELCDEDLGLRVEVMQGWASPNLICKWIQEDLQKNPRDRSLDGHLSRDFEPALRYWPLVGQYLRRKFRDLNHLPLRMFEKFLQAYQHLPYDEVLFHLRKAPFYKDDSQIVEAFKFILSHVFYSAQVVTHFINTSQRTMSASALCSYGWTPRGKVPLDSTQQTGMALLTMLLNQLRDGGLVCPAVGHLEDALSLRQDSRVRDFRQTLWNWVESVRSGKIDTIRKVASEVGKANNALKAIGECRRLSNWIAVATLPAGVFDMKLGRPVLSTVLGFGGLSLVVIEKSFKKRADWLLFLQGRKA